MNVLAVTWHGYYAAILAVAGLIGVIGAALGYLKDWLRAAQGLAQRVWHNRRQASPVDPERVVEPTPDQVRVLNTVYRYFQAHGKPAPFWELDKILDREGVSLRRQAESMPRGLLMPDVSHRGGAYHTDDELMVTVDGLRYCAGGMAVLDLLASVLEFMARREKYFMPTTSQSKLVVQAVEVKDALELSPLEVEQTLVMLQHLEPRVWNHIGHPTDSRADWNLTVDLEDIRRFRGIRNAEEYLQARAGTQSFAHRPSGEATL